MWKRLIFLWKRKQFEERTESGSTLGSDYLYTELEAEANYILLLPHPWFKLLRKFSSQSKKEILRRHLAYEISCWFWTTGIIV